MAGFLTFLPLYTPEVGMAGPDLPLADYGLVVVGLRIVGARLPDRFGAVATVRVGTRCSAVGPGDHRVLPQHRGLIDRHARLRDRGRVHMPALLALAVSRVPSSERGTVVGTATLFLDVVFGIAPVALGALPMPAATRSTFLVSAALAAVAAGLLVGRPQQPGVARCRRRAGSLRR